MPYTPPPTATVDTSALMVVVNAGSNLATARPAGAGAVYWKFNTGVNVGTNGVNVTNAQPGDQFFVAS